MKPVKHAALPHRGAGGGVGHVFVFARHVVPQHMLPAPQTELPHSAGQVLVNVIGEEVSTISTQAPEQHIWRPLQTT